MELTKVFEMNMLSSKRIVIDRGGTRSSKTVSLCQLIAFWLFSGRVRKPNKEYDERIEEGVCNIVRQYSATLDKTIIKDFEMVLELMEARHLVNHNKTKKSYTYGKRTVQFTGADDDQKVRGLRSDILYCNEANELKWNTFKQLLRRCEGVCFIDFNPDDPNVWIKTELEDKRMQLKGDVEVIVSNYTHNHMLSEALVQEIEYLRETDPEEFAIYGMGEYGEVRGLVLKHAGVKDIPKGAEFVGYGLDFGFTGSATACVAVWMAGNELYCDEVIYKRELTNPDIADELKRAGVTTEEVICDHAEPKSIEELKRLRINAKPCGKKDKTLAIDILRRFKIYSTPQSDNFRNEVKTWKYQVDKNGEQVRDNRGKLVPVKFNDHLMDALCYLAQYKLKENKSVFMWK